MRDFRVEWYAQDHWRVSKRFTVEAGVRFYWFRPNINAFPNTAVFDPASYSLSQQPPLIQPYIDPASGARVGPGSVLAPNTSFATPCPFLSKPPNL